MIRSLQSVVDRGGDRIPEYLILDIPWDEPGRYTLSVQIRDLVADTEAAREIDLPVH